VSISFADSKRFTVPLRLTRGERFQRTITLESAPGTPIPIAGWAFKGEIRRTIEPTASLIAAFTCAVIGDGTAGQFSITIDESITRALALDNGQRESLIGYYDLFAVTPTPTALFGGAFYLIDACTLI
jgi:hypothetical protein